MADSERIDRIESQVQRLTRSLQELMFAVKRNVDDIAAINRRSESEEWRERIESLHESDIDRVEAGLKTLGRDVETLRRPATRPE